MTAMESEIEQAVVVKTTDTDAFVLTAYLTDQVKKGILLWPTLPDK